MGGQEIVIIPMLEKYKSAILVKERFDYLLNILFWFVSEINIDSEPAGLDFVPIYLSQNAHKTCPEQGRRSLTCRSGLNYKEIKILRLSISKLHR